MAKNQVNTHWQEEVIIKRTIAPGKVSVSVSYDGVELFSQTTERQTWQKKGGATFVDTFLQHLMNEAPVKEKPPVKRNLIAKLLGYHKL